MNPRLVIAPLLLALLAACAQPATRPAARPEFINSPDALKSGRPFSEAVRIGGFIFLAGQIGDDPATGKPAAGGIKPEARQALQHIQKVLEDNGASLADVVKCTVFLADIGEWASFNEVYKEFFRPPYPARSALGSSGLALGARVEVECLAYVEPAAH
jgi:2-iminobutanoate/2-iminopropanoate deaminase